MMSLVDGSATRGERMMVMGIVTLFAAFFLVFVGVGLMLVKVFVVAALIPVIPGLWVSARARDAWRGYRAAKMRLTNASRAS